MLARFPGSLVNRALRSRLVSAQQYRATIAARRSPQPWIASRSLNDLSFLRELRRDGDTQSDAAKRRPKQVASSGRERNRTQFFKTTRGKALLMSIASNQPTGRHNARDTYEDTEAQQTSVDAEDAPSDDPYDFDLPASEAPNDETPTSTSTTESPYGKASDRKSQREFWDGGSKITPKIINMELKWMTDPRDLADRVQRLLEIDDPDKAAALVRAATKQGIRSDIAWSHLLNYCFEQDHPQAAFKFWNDMKKRGKRPGSKAYTAMLKGLSSITPSPATMQIAENIYRSISAPNSQVERGIIHTNAMLSVCNHHGEMDRLWEIISDIPEEGPGAPDAATYTVILHAIQYAGRRDIAKMSPDDIKKILDRKAQVVTEGKRIWSDVIWRWKNKTLEIDDQLVSGMANLLLDGASDMDCYNVLELYKQTMGIPILQKRPLDSPSSTRRRISREDQDAIRAAEADRQENTEDVPFVNADNEPLDMSDPFRKVEEAERSMDETKEAEDFSDVFQPIVRDTEGLVYLKPGSKELTHILSACFTMTQGLEGGQAYWSHLTLHDTPHRFDPDTYTYIQYFRLLRISRSSKICVKTVREQMVPSGQATGLAFHVAFSVCRRDRRNASVLLHANELVSLMDKTLVLPDVRVLEKYLSMIRAFSMSPTLLLNLRGLDTEDTTSTKDKKTPKLTALHKKLQARLRLVAIYTLQPFILQLHTALESVLAQLDTSTEERAIKKPRKLSTDTSEPPFQGDAGVKLMAHFRLLLDEVLQPEYKAHVSKAERKALDATSQLLKKYSSQSVIKAIGNKRIYPTERQKAAAAVRIRLHQASSYSSDEWA